MDIDTFFSKSTFREVRTLFFRMEELALLVLKVAIREETTLKLLFLFSLRYVPCWMLFSFSSPDVVFVGT
jgi:hypothetical protein